MPRRHAGHLFLNDKAVKRPGIPGLFSYMSFRENRHRGPCGSIWKEGKAPCPAQAFRKASAGVVRDRRKDHKDYIYRLAPCIEDKTRNKEHEILYPPRPVFLFVEYPVKMLYNTVEMILRQRLGAFGEPTAHAPVRGLNGMTVK